MKLPLDIVIEIMLVSNPDTLQSLSTVSKSIRQIVKSDYFWKKKYRQDYGIATGITTDWYQRYINHNLLYIVNVKKSEIDAFIPISVKEIYHGFIKEQNHCMIIDQSDNIFLYYDENVIELDLPFGKNRDIHNIYFDVDVRINNLYRYNLWYINRNIMYKTTFSVNNNTVEMMVTNEIVNNVLQFIPDYRAVLPYNSEYGMDNFLVLTGGTIYSYNDRTRRIRQVYTTINKIVKFAVIVSYRKHRLYIMDNNHRLWVCNFIDQNDETDRAEIMIHDIIDMHYHFNVLNLISCDGIGQVLSVKKDDYDIALRRLRDTAVIQEDQILLRYDIDTRGNIIDLMGRPLILGDFTFNKFVMMSGNKSDLMFCLGDKRYV